MTTDTNWPNPERPGVPMFPDRDGLHVMLGPFDTFPQIVLWQSNAAIYLKGNIELTPEELFIGKISYCGPHLTPTQLTELLAGERERICLMIERSLDASCSLLPTAGKTLLKAVTQDITDAIRNLGDAP